METIKGSVMLEIYRFIGNEADKTRDIERKKALRTVQNVMKSAIKGGLIGNGTPLHDLNEEMADTLLHKLRAEIKRIGKAHHPNISAWNVLEVYREAFHRFFTNDTIPKTVMAFRSLTVEYIF